MTELGCLVGQTALSAGHALQGTFPREACDLVVDSLLGSLAGSKAPTLINEFQYLFTL